MHFFYSKTDRDASESLILDEFDFINDFGFEEYKDIRQKPLSLHYNRGIEICYVTKGRYEWVVGDTRYLLFPGDGFITCPWEKHGSPHEVVDLGEIYWIVLKPQIFEETGIFKLGDWSRLNQEENKLIGDVLSKNSNHKLSKAIVLKSLFTGIKSEIDKKQFAYRQKICSLSEELLITSIRLIQDQEEQIKKNLDWFMKFEIILHSDISKKWTLEEMASQNRIGITTLTHLIKEHTGYTPANYIIFIRLVKAKNLLTMSTKQLTEIALECGFYSSQHFSSTFAKWVGISPLKYRKMMKKVS